MIASIDFIILFDFHRTLLLFYRMTFIPKNGNLGNLMETSQHFWLGSEN
jgi:hypothetical protein